MSNIHFYQGQNNLLSNFDDKTYIDNENTDEQKILEIKKRIAEFFNIKNIHFLFGSGTSCNAIPNMKGLLKNVKKAVYSHHDKKIKLEFYAITKRLHNKNNLEEILGILYSNKVYLENNYERTEERYICTTLIDLIEKTIFEKINVNFSDEESKKVLNNYKTLYGKVALRNRDFSRINVFTTNNDLFNEFALDSLNIHYINGFGGGINKFFNPALFNYTYSKRMDTSIEKFEPVENMVNLYKIHGSINWIEDKSKDNTFFNIREIDRPENRGIDKNILIYPTPTKQNKSLGSPYVELFREFQKKLLQPHSVLFIIGYSFNDEHVNNIIYQALATNSTINVVILNDIKESIISKVEDNRVFRIWGTTYDENTGQEINIHYFNYIVNNLFPNIDANKNENVILEKFINFYNDNLTK